jgi:FixJ family two-component response regulator
MTTAEVLVVEDHEGLRQALVRLLQASGYRVSAYESAEALLAAAPRLDAGCLILDVRLPGLSGFDLRRRLVTEGWRAPAIYMTAHDDPGTRLRAEREGAPFFRKPFEGRALLGAVARALAPTDPDAPKGNPSAPKID